MSERSITIDGCVVTFDELARALADAAPVHTVTQGLSVGYVLAEEVFKRWGDEEDAQ